MTGRYLIYTPVESARDKKRFDAAWNKFAEVCRSLHRDGLTLPGGCTTILEIIPVINKIDLPAAEPERFREQIETIIGLDASDAVL